MKLKVVIIILLNFTLILNLSSQRVLTKNTGHSKEIFCLDISPDGKYLASYSFDNTIKLWDIKTGKELRTLNVGKNTPWNFRLQFSPKTKEDPFGGRYLVTTGNKLMLWETGTGKCLNSREVDSIFTLGIDYSNDGNYILTGSIKTRLLNATTLEEVKSFNSYQCKNGIFNVKFSPDGKHYFSGDLDGNLKKFDTKTGKEVKTYLENKSFEKAIFDIDVNKNLLVATINNESCKLFDIKTGKLIKTFGNPADNMKRLELSPDGKWLITLGASVKLWNIETDEMKSLNVSTDLISDITFSPDGSYFIYSDAQGNLKQLEFKSLNEIKTLKSNVSDFKNAIFHPNKDIIITETEEINIWNYTNSTHINKLNLPENCILNYNCNAKFTNNEKYFFYSCVDTTNLPLDLRYLILRWDLQTNQIKYISDENYKSFFDYRISPDGKYVIPNNSLENLTNIETGEKVQTLKIPNVNFGNTIFYDNGNSLISVGNDSIIYLLDFESMRIESTIKEDFRIVNLQISPDGQYLITIPGEEEEITSGISFSVWNLKTKKKEFSIKDINGGLTSFSPDSKYFVLGDKSIILYDLNTRKKVRTFNVNSRIRSLAFDQSGKYLVTSHVDGNVHIFNLDSGKLLITLVSIKNSNDWIVTTPDGRFDGTEKGMELLYYVEGMEIIPLSSLYEEFYTPNLLSRIMAGEEFKTPDININSLKLPPEVTILSPHTNTNSSAKEVKIDAKVKDLGGGIDEVRLYQNGKLIETTQKGFKTTERADEIKNISFSIQLNEGENIIKLSAFNNQRTESKPYEIVLHKVGLKKTSNLYMIIIGIDKYKNSQYNLNYATADAEAIKNMIENNSLEIFNSVKIEFLKDELANKQNIKKKFDELVSKTNQEDVFLFYYAGHGVMSIEEKPIYYIIPYDVVQMYGDNKTLKENAISAEELKEFAMNLKAQKQLYIFDACQSGGMTDHIASRGAAEEKAIALLARSTGTYWLTASGTEQYATEFAQLGHGLYTYAILKGLEGEADSGNNDRQITVQELDVFLKNIVPELSKKYKGDYQFPKSYGGGDDFPLIILK